MGIMRLLVLGGSWFLGRAVVEESVARGWEVTVFHRSRSGQDTEGVDPTAVTLRITMRVAAPLLIHNGRLADPLDVSERRIPHRRRRAHAPG
jgi:nucleoside-diphosphate-sugar epimerase